MQSLDVTYTSEDTVYIVCLFNTFSTDSGCTVVLISTTDQQQQYEGTFNKMDDDIASGNITGVATGVYNICAFDQGSNVVAVELLSVTITEDLHVSSTTNNIPTVTSAISTTISASASFSSSSIACKFFCIMHCKYFLLSNVLDHSSNTNVPDRVTSNSRGNHAAYI